MAEEELTWLRERLSVLSEQMAELRISLERAQVQLDERLNSLERITEQGRKDLSRRMDQMGKDFERLDGRLFQILIGVLGTLLAAVITLIVELSK